MPSSSAEEEPFVEIEEARLRTFQQAGPPTRGLKSSAKPGLTPLTSPRKRKWPNRFRCNFLKAYRSCRCAGCCNRWRSVPIFVMSCRPPFRYSGACDERNEMALEWFGQRSRHLDPRQHHFASPSLFPHCPARKETLQ